MSKAKSKLLESHFLPISNTAMVAGKDLKVEVRPIFEGQSARPIGFDVDWWIDGKKFNQPFENTM